MKKLFTIFFIFYSSMTMADLQEGKVAGYIPYSNENRKGGRLISGC